MLSNDGSTFIVSTSEFDKILLEVYKTNLQTNEIQTTEELSKFDFPGRIILSHDFAKFKELILMAVGLSNGTVEFFYARNGKFYNAISLNIEQNLWIRSLAFKGYSNLINLIFFNLKKLKMDYFWQPLQTI